MIKRRPARWAQLPRIAVALQVRQSEGATGDGDVPRTPPRNALPE